MTDNANVFVTFTGGPYQTHLTFDDPYVGNYIGTLGGYPSLVGNSAVQLVGGAGKLRMIDVGLNIANAGGNTTIAVPTSSQVSNNQLYLNANGQWAVPPGTYSAPAGYTGTFDLQAYSDLAGYFHLNYFNFANGILMSIT